MMSLILKLFQHNWLATFYFNFRMLPFRQAIHLPFDFAHSVRFDSLKGRVILNAKGPLHRAMVRVGGRESDIMPRCETVLSIDGELIVNGDFVELGMGTSTVIRKGARLCLGSNVKFGCRTKIYCSRLIEIGDHVSISWECQIFDTNFHSMLDRRSGETVLPEGEVHVGSFVWIGNRCNVLKGTCLPSNIIMASNSLANRDYSDVSPYSLLAGMPVHVVKTDVQRLFEGYDIP